MQRYKGFTIETIEDDPEKFKAVIRKADCSTLRTVRPPGPDAPAVTTLLYSRPEDAIVEAKRVIDAGGII